eukprot:GHUV01041837.1.p1 GENE.GHUV01041837.1~~GHUV01041837.1.p1  ORF type:complete len:174 (-),score=24.28 GHUV01041837.1:70-591(-)
MESFGFSMVPEAAIKLVGAPECQSADVTFTVMASKTWVQPGPLELTLPFQIKGGPAVLLTLRAVLVVPEVALNQSSLDFGTVGAGHCKVKLCTADLLCSCTGIPRLCLCYISCWVGCFWMLSLGNSALSGCFLLELSCSGVTLMRRSTPCSSKTFVKCQQNGASKGQQLTAQN